MGQTDKVETPQDETTQAPDPVQTPDTPGKDENGDGLKGGQATADVPGDVLGI